MNKIGFLGLGIEMFEVNPVAFTLFGKEIYWYGIIIAIGFLTAIIVCSSIAKKDGLSEDNVYDIVFWATIPCIISARLYYVIFNIQDYIKNPVDIFKIWEGGIAIYGAIIGGAIVVHLYSKSKNLSTLKVFDLCSIGVIIGQIVGRWGNFVNAEAHGVETTLPWRMAIIEGGKMIEVHPTFLYESLWNLGVLAILFIVFFKKRYDGEVFFTYALGYGIGRAIIEGLRTDSLYIGPFRISQLVGIVSAVVAIVFIVINNKKLKENTPKTDET
ncbi:MAG: prolipoprotein diacylglyceryl transferase [Ruminococcaceae bacterium]|nr:prolipoprotein diacylglyceryl transferase [Oscillospiraceae bacterium]